MCPILFHWGGGLMGGEKTQSMGSTLALFMWKYWYLYFLEKRPTRHKFRVEKPIGYDLMDISSSSPGRLLLHSLFTAIARRPHIACIALLARLISPCNSAKCFRFSYCARSTSSHCSTETSFEGLLASADDGIETWR